MWELHLEAVGKMNNVVEKSRYAGRYWKLEFLELGSVTPKHRNSVSYSVVEGNSCCFLDHTHLNAHTHTHSYY